MEPITKLLDAAGRLFDRIQNMGKDARGTAFRIVTLFVIAIAFTSIAAIA